MRSLNPFEEVQVKFLTKLNIPFSLLEPTETALTKSIIDATIPFRRFLKEHKIHDYETQGDGNKEHGIQLPTIIISPDALEIETVTSFYRPKAKPHKQGDPRVWVYKLKKIVSPNDIIICFYHQSKIYVLNLTKTNMEDFHSSTEPNPVQYLLEAIQQDRSTISNELLEKIRDISKNGYIEAIGHGDTSIGRTLESALGISMNSSKLPDYKGIELKSYRSKRNSRKNLFTKVQNWKLSKFKNDLELLENIGYVCPDKNRLQLNVTVNGKNENAQGLLLSIDEKEDHLVESCNQNGIGDFAIWLLDDLRTALKIKHAETFWIEADSKIENGKEYFKFKKILHTRNPLIENFEILIENGAITLDHILHIKENGKVRSHGVPFKLKPRFMEMLFPENTVYEI